jgi:radical SAM protein with 4Fe4S-binding SPASM domain
MTHPTIIKHGGFHPNYAEEIEYFKNNKVYSIQIELTTSCDQECLFCYASNQKHQLKHMSNTDVKTILNSAKTLKVKAIDWLGGDPLLHPHWQKMMQKAQKLGLTNNIWTSGIPLANKEIARQTVNVTKNGFISVHLDTLDPQIYQQLHTGKPQEKINLILKGIENVQKLGKKPDEMINCITFNKLVANDVEKTISYFYKKKGMRTCLTQMCPTGLAESHPEWIPTQKEIKQACEIRDTINYPDTKISMATMDTNKYYCGGIICITIDGDVTPCSVIRQGVGNIHKQPLTQIITKHRNTLLFTHLRNQNNLPKNCTSCENNSVCWGCRATAYYNTGNSCDMDPNCYKTRIN